MSPHARIKKMVRHALRHAEDNLVAPEKRIPEGVTAWSSVYKFSYPKGRVHLTLHIDTNPPADDSPQIPTLSPQPETQPDGAS